MQIFDEEWIAAATETLARVARRFWSLMLSLNTRLAGVPMGRVILTVSLTDGVVTGIAVGKSKDSDIAISMSYPDAVAILSGEMTSDAGYMSGAVKVEGDYPRWLLDLRPVRLAAIEALAPVMAQTYTP